MPWMAAFHGDHGLDLLIALRIIRGEYFPLIGPFLSVNSLNNPPTYLYFLAGLLAVLRSEMGIIYVFTAMNLMSGFLYAMVLQRVTDTVTAGVFFFLYMIMFSSVEQGRTFWNPYAAPFFLAWGMWIFVASPRRFPIARFCAGVAISVIGITMYPTGLLLIPAYVWYGHRFLQSLSFGRTRTLAISTLSFTLALFLFCWPQVLYEYHHGFPSVYAILSPTRTSLDSGAVALFDGPAGLFRRSGKFLVGLYYLIMPRYYQNDFISNHIVIFTVAALISISGTIAACFSRAHRHLFVDLFRRLGFVYIAFAAIPYFFLESEVYTYRLIIFLPYILFLVSYAIRAVLKSGNGVSKLVAASLLSLIVYFNISLNTVNATFYKESTRYGNIVSLYNYLVNDIRQRSLSVSDVDIHVITHRDHVNWEVMPLWYFLKRDNPGYFVSMMPGGNLTVRSNTISAGIRYAYVICYPALLDDGECWENFTRENADVLIRAEQDVWPNYVYFVEKQGQIDR